MKRSTIETVLGAVVLFIAGFFLVFSYKTANVGAVDGYTLTADFADRRAFGRGQCRYRRRQDRLGNRRHPEPRGLSGHGSYEHRPENQAPRRYRCGDQLGQPAGWEISFA